MEIQGIMFFEKIDNLKYTCKMLKETSINKFLNNNIFKDKIYTNDKKEIGDYFEIINKEKKISKSSKKVDFLIKLKAFYDRLKSKMKSSSKNQNEEKYYLINKKWLNEYKSFIKYDKFLEIFKNNNLSDQQLMEKIQKELEINEDDFISL